MYAHFLAVAERFVGHELARHVIWLGPLLAVISFVMLCSPAWQKREKEASEGRGRLAMLTLFWAALFRLILAASVVGVLGAALLAQRGLFSEEHGRVTQRNYNAVKAKWGIPHEQRDLRVEHFIMRKVIQEELSDGATRERPLDVRQPAMGEEDRVILNEEALMPPAGAQEANVRHVLRRITLLARAAVPQDSIEAADVKILLRSNPRTLGNAVYAGYDDTWLLKYDVRNRSEYATQAVFQFPLPGEGHGLFNELKVKLDNQDWIPKTQYRNGQLEWRMVMQPGAKHSVEIGYASRGLEYFRYRPGGMRERCAVVVDVDGIDARRLNFPIGAMPPYDDLKLLAGKKYALHWDLSRAVTNLDIGLIVPAEEQPGYHIIRLLEAAPLGLALLAVALLTTRWLLKARFDLLPVSLALLAFYVGHALLANLNDVIASFPVAFAASMIPLTAAVAAFWHMVDGLGPVAIQSSVIMALFALFYPLASLCERTGGTMLYVLYANLVIYVLALVARHLTQRTRHGR